MGRRRFQKRTPHVRKEPEHRINGRIRARAVRLVEVDGTGINEVMDTRDALALAREKELDLVEISGKSDPPVVKIMEYAKFAYDQKKAKKAAKANQHTSEVKELRFGPNTDDHDLAFKLKHAERFLSEGNKLKVYVQFRGRNIIYKQRGRDMLDRIKDSLSEISKVESPPAMNGRRMIMMLAPAKS